MQELVPNLHGHARLAGGMTDPGVLVLSYDALTMHSLELPELIRHHCPLVEVEKKHEANKLQNSKQMLRERQVAREHHSTPPDAAANRMRHIEPLPPT